MFGVQFGNQFSGSEDLLGQQYTKTLTDALNVASVLLKSIGKTLTSAINASSVFLKSTTKRISDTFVIATQSISTFKAMGLSLVDVLSVSSVYARVLTMARTFTESINTASVFTKNIRKTVSDALIIIDVTIDKLVSRILEFMETLIAKDTYSMRLNGVFLKWRIIIRDIGSSYWTVKNRVTSLWTEKPRQE